MSFAGYAAVTQDRGDYFGTAHELPHTDSIGAIAQRFGFADDAHFSRTFHTMHVT